MTDRPAQPMHCRPAALAGPDDADWLRSIAAGRLEHFDAFVDRYKHRLMAYLVQCVGDAHRAEDLLQETFLKAFRAAGRGGTRPRSAAAVPAWLFTIARRCVLDYHRACRRKPITFQSAPAATASAAPTPAEQMVSVEDQHRAVAALDDLPDDQRQAVLLRLFGELSFDEIARITDTNISTAKSRVRYGLARLGELLTDEQEVHHD